MKPRHVLAATDFSDASDEALRQAHGYARRAGARLTVLHVVPDILRASPLLPAGSARRVDTEVELETRALDDLAARVKEITGRPRYEVEIAVRSGRPDASVVRFAEENEVDVVVSGATGRTGLARLLLGGTAERIVRHAHCSVLVARVSPPSDHVLVATDLSDAALPAVARARLEAEQRNARLDLLHVMDLSGLGWAAAAAPFGGAALSIPPEQLAQMRSLAMEALRALGGPGATAHVEMGSPKRCIVSLSESLPAGIVLVGTHGHTGLARMALGSVAEAVARAAHCSVLVVRKPAPRPARSAAGNFDD
jgi:nucleotide-binding universal stress UspA family protein